MRRRLQNLSDVQRLTLFLPVLMGGVLIVMVTPLKDTIPWPPCPFKALTGCYCPGCGSTRSMMALADGDVLLSFRQNPFVIFTLVYLLLAWVKVIRVFRSGSALTEKAHPKLIAGLGVVIIMFGILRNFVPLLAPL